MSSLRQTINAEAARFAQAIVEALRSSSLDELMSIAGSTPRSGSASAKTTPKIRNGRLGRHSAGDIDQTLSRILDLLGNHPEGLRAEQIKASLGLDKREMPRPIASGLASGALSKSGQKRATVYFAGSGAALPKKRVKKTAAKPGDRRS